MSYIETPLKKLHFRYNLKTDYKLTLQHETSK